tara:strand:- start:923 stop:1123 length:201 start_codon:yes stop_codon:yes gene_type:complete
MIQLSYIHNGKKGFFTINIEHIVYFEAAENPPDGTKSYVHLSTKSTLRVAESYSAIWAILEAHNGE